MILVNILFKLYCCQSVSDSTIEDDGFESTIRESHSIHQLRQTALSVHNKRLDKILCDKGVQRISMPANGDCFFNASSLHLVQYDDESLRTDLYIHIRDHSQHCIEFLNLEGNSEEKEICFLEKIEPFKSKSSWNHEASDLLPLALAGFSK